MIDIIEVKTLINKGDLEVSVFNGNILLKDKRNGEAVKIGSASGMKTLDYNPTPTQWEMIKKMASLGSNAKPSDVFVLQAELCNDQVDSDFERFDRESLPEIAEKFIGVKGIVGNKELCTGTNAAIFDAETVIKDGVAKVRAYIFVYRNSVTEEVLKLVSFGIKTEVHVGLSMRKSYCSICEEEYGGFDCDHTKGQIYRGETCHVVLSEPDQAFEFHVKCKMS